MDKFKMKHPTNADFEEKLAKYAKLADDVWRQACCNLLYELFACMLFTNDFFSLTQREMCCRMA